MTLTWRGFARNHGDNRSLALLALATAIALLLMPSFNIVDFDAAFMVWAADGVLHHSIYGRDILDVNPPLCMMLYFPAAILKPLFGYEWAVRVWMFALTLLSILGVWHVADKDQRLPICLVLLLFVTLALPSYFAQREQIVFLLCAPYVSGVSRGRGWGVVSGVMAGIGFMTKPYFLIPLILIVAQRRRVGTEERAIVAAGVAYAAVLLIFFRPYLFEMVPTAIITYWAIYFPLSVMLMQAAIVLVAVVSLTVSGTAEPTSTSLLTATVGFVMAALLQQKGFVYHFIPAYGFLALACVSRTLSIRLLTATIGLMFLLIESAFLTRLESMNARYDEAAIRAVVLAEVSRSSSYVSFVPGPFPGFPAAIQTTSKFVGIAQGPAFIGAVAMYAVGLASGDSTKVEHLAIDQVLRELDRRPEMVITLNGPMDIHGRSFDLMAWYNQNERFREVWSNYALDRIVGPLRFYRRK